jgi:hypothetical protein
MEAFNAFLTHIEGTWIASNVNLVLGLSAWGSSTRQEDIRCCEALNVRYPVWFLGTQALESLLFDLAVAQENLCVETLVTALPFVAATEGVLLPQSKGGRLSMRYQPRLMAKKGPLYRFNVAMLNQAVNDLSSRVLEDGIPVSTVLKAAREDGITKALDVIGAFPSGWYAISYGKLIFLGPQGVDDPPIMASKATQVFYYGGT